MSDLRRDVAQAADAIREAAILANESGQLTLYSGLRQAEETLRLLAKRQESIERTLWRLAAETLGQPTGGADQ